MKSMMAFCCDFADRQAGRAGLKAGRLCRPIGKIIVVAFMAMWLQQPVLAVDMDQYHKHIGKFHQWLDKARQARARGDVKEADKFMAKADDEKALADVALNAPGRMMRINDPSPIVYHDWPYYDRYWGRPGWGPWWGYPYRW